MVVTARFFDGNDGRMRQSMTVQRHFISDQLTIH